LRKAKFGIYFLMNAIFGMWILFTGDAEFYSQGALK